MTARREIAVRLVSGSWPPARCGVGDYTEMLALALEGQGATVLRAGPPEIPPATITASKASRILAEGCPDIVHVQYPTSGYGRSLMPALLPLLLRQLPVIVTLHEFSIFRRYRWPWFAPFAYAAAAIVFTSAFEQACFLKRFPRCRAETCVIPIGSNIPQGPDLPRDQAALCHFGLIMPGKGVEHVLTLALALVRAGAPYRVSIIGAVAPGHDAYAKTIIDAATALGITLHLGMQAEDVAILLKQVTYAYLPFPDGATERRGSLLATLLNGVTVLAPTGPQTPAWVCDSILDSATPEAAAAILLGDAAARRPRHTTPAPDISWASIASQHLRLYEGATQSARPQHA